MRVFRLFTGLLLFALSAGAIAQAQSCRSDQERRTPTSDFTVHSDGTVTHHTTSLMWSRCAVGQQGQEDRCRGRADNLTWQQAVDVASLSELGGHNDWRLPTMRELSSILDQSCRSPSINLTVFPDASSSWFWSASSYAYDQSLKWSIFFDIGYQDYTGPHHPSNVRLVRTVN